MPVAIAPNLVREQRKAGRLALHGAGNVQPAEAIGNLPRIGAPQSVVSLPDALYDLPLVEAR